MKAFSITIPKPCSENWNHFKPTSTGGFCSSCQKTVIDFTMMSDEEIQVFFRHVQAHTCGRFRTDQIKSYSFTEPVKAHPGATLFKAGLLSLLFVLLGRQQSSAQEFKIRYKTEIIQPVNQSIDHEGEKTTNTDTLIVRGIVKVDDDNLPLAGVTVTHKGTTDGTVSDEHGAFLFPKKLKAGEVLVFSFIGLQPKEYVIPVQLKGGVEIRMGLDTCVVLGEVAVDEVYSKKQTGFRKFWAGVKQAS